LGFHWVSPNSTWEGRIQVSEVRVFFAPNISHLDSSPHLGNNHVNNNRHGSNRYLHLGEEFVKVWRMLSPHNLSSILVIGNLHATIVES
jgi:hypothetical protein